MLGVRTWYAVRHWQLGRRFRLGTEAARREGGVALVLRVVLFGGFVAAVIIYAVGPAWLGRFTAAAPAWLRWTGAGVAAASLVMLVWVHQSLGRFWSVNLELARDHALVETGPYRWVAHPMYTAFIGYLGGVALVSANALIAVPAAGAIGFIVQRIPREEAMMLERFGDAYRAYRRRTGRLVPRQLWTPAPRS
jgi:protein-S-isoprenylcysteine O-methyltransferase Ste14